MKAIVLAMVVAGLLLVARPALSEEGFGGERRGPRQDREGGRGRMDREGGHGQKQGWRGMRGEKPSPEDIEKFKEIKGLELESGKLAQQYRQAETDEEKASISTELRSLLEKIFDLKLVLKKKHVENLEKKLTELKAKLEKREQARSEVIQNRFDQLTEGKKDDHLRW